MPESLLLDTTLIIDWLRDDPRAERFIASLEDDTLLATHAIVQAEVLEGLRNAKELGECDRLFRQFEIIHPDESDSARALAWLRRLHFSHRIGFPDCSLPLPPSGSPCQLSP
ncbi:MAG TPA: PIN domain-containing protein [Phycisphaerae bacterium]|nr:PIN domain-containing protein [Phycisphaerae bacterium]